MAWFCRTQQDKSCEGTWLLIFSQWPILMGYTKPEWLGEWLDDWGITEGSFCHAVDFHEWWDVTTKENRGLQWDLNGISRSKMMGFYHSANWHGYENDMSLPVSEDVGWKPLLDVVSQYCWMLCRMIHCRSQLRRRSNDLLVIHRRPASQNCLSCWVFDMFSCFWRSQLRTCYVRVGILRIPDILDGSPHLPSFLTMPTYSQYTAP